MPLEVVIKTLFILIVVVGAFAPVITWVERKQSAVMQDRIGANRADIAGIRLIGLFHPIADVLKLLSKEELQIGREHDEIHHSRCRQNPAATAAAKSFAVNHARPPRLPPPEACPIAA